MPRPANTVGTTSMTISVLPQIMVYLEDLALKGLGGSPQEVAKNLLTQAVMQFVDSGKLKERQWRPMGEGKVELIP